MRENGLTFALRESRPAVTGWLQSGSSYLAEVVSHAGYDAVIVDLQHGMYGIDTAIPLLQAISTGDATPGVRLPDHDPATIGKVLDAGAYFLICPAVDSPEQAQALVAAVRYPPTGLRSYGPSRGLLYGGADYVERAHDTIEVWALIESSDGLRNAGAVASTPGIGGLFIGPNDLALSLRETPGERSEVVDSAIRDILNAAHGAGSRAGIFCAEPSMAKEMAGLGFDLIAPGNDVSQIRDVARERLHMLKGS